MLRPYAEQLEGPRLHRGRPGDDRQQGIVVPLAFAAGSARTMVERSFGSVRKLWTGSPPATCLLSALALALSETAAFSIGEDGIYVRHGQANNPLLLNAGYHETDIAVPWFKDRRLQISFV